MRYELHAYITPVVRPFLIKLLGPSLIEIVRPSLKSYQNRPEVTLSG